MEPYPSRQFGFIDDPDRQVGNGLVWTRTRTRSDGPEPLLTLTAGLLQPGSKVDAGHSLAAFDTLCIGFGPHTPLSTRSAKGKRY